MKTAWFAAVLLIAASSVFGQARVFVSGSGSDSNACTVTSPCRSFAHAITVVSSGGEIIPLDSAGYGSVTIDRSVSISAPEGIYAGVTASGSGAVGITISTASVNVFLRGLTINGVGASTGVLALSDSVSLEIERLNVANFIGACIDFESPGGLLFASDSSFRNAYYGVWVNGTATTAARATLDRLRGTGLNWGNSSGSLAIAQDYAIVTVRDSVVSGSWRGFEVYDSGQLKIDHCVSTHNAVGLFAGAGWTGPGSPVAYVSNSTIADNTLKGIEVLAGAINSRGDNTVVGNASAETFSGTFAAK